MLSHHSRELLKELLTQIGLQEKQLEVVRQVLCEQPEFEPYAAYRRIDRTRKGFITSTDIHEFLFSNDFHFTEEECCFYINHYDRDGDKKLVYSEFLPSLLPFDNPDLRTMVTQRKVLDIKHNEFLPYEVEYALARVVAQEIFYYKELDGLKNQLASEYDFTFFDAFATIDIYETGFIDYNLLKNFLKTAGTFPKEEHIIEILRRMDKDDDGRIKYEEFVEAIQAVAPGLGRSGTSKRAPQKSGIYGKTAQLPGNPYEESDKNLTATQKTRLRSPLKKTSATRTQQQQRSISPQKKLAQTYQSLGSVPRTEEKPKQSSMFLDDQRFETRLSQSAQKKSQTKTQSIRSEKTVAGVTPLTSLIIILKELISLEREVEFAKQDLALRSDYNLMDAFRLFDRKGKGIITVKEFENVFQEFNLYPAKEDIYLLIKRLDRDGDGKLKFTEFTAGFAPVQKEYYDLVKARVAINGDLTLNLQELFDAQTRQLFKRLLLLYLENEAVIEALRQKLTRNKGGFNVRAAFELMDLDADGYLTHLEIKDIMDANDVFVSDKDVEYLINRFNKSDSRKISYGEFIQEISPKSQKKY